MSFLARHFPIGLLLIVVGICCVVLKEAIGAAQRDAIRPTDPQVSLVLNTVGFWTLLVGALWLTLAGLSRLLTRR